MSKKEITSLFANPNQNISMVVSIVKSFSSDPAGNYWSARIIDGIEGKGNSPIQALDAAIANLKRTIREAEEELEVKTKLKNRIAKELFGDCDPIDDRRRNYMQTRSPSDLVTDVAALMKKMLHENCIKFNTEDNSQYEEIVRQQKERRNKQVESMGFKKPIDDISCSCGKGSLQSGIPAIYHKQSCNVYQNFILAEAKRIEYASMH